MTDRMKPNGLFKKFRVLFFLCMLCMVFRGSTVQAAATIFDDAGLLTETETSKLKESLNALSKAGAGDCFIVTCNSGAETSQETAETVFDRYTNSDSGIVCILQMDIREMNLIAFGNTAYYLSDSRIEEALDQAANYAGSRDYYSFFVSLTESCLGYMKKGLAGHYVYDEDTGKIIEKKVITPAEAGIALIAAIFSGAALFFITKSRYKAKNQGAKYAVSKDAKLSLSHKSDILVNSFVTHRRIPKNNGGSGGKGGGGGMTHVHHTSGGHTATGGHGRKF